MTNDILKWLAECFKNEGDIISFCSMVRMGGFCIINSTVGFKSRGAVGLMGRGSFLQAWPPFSDIWGPSHSI